MRAMLAIAACVLLAGCWQSHGSLYADRTSLQPLRSGEAESAQTENAKDHGRVALAQTADGYRLTNDDRKDPDFGRQLSFALFSPGGRAVRYLSIFEAVDGCKANDNMCTARNALRYYGLARIVAAGQRHHRVWTQSVPIAARTIRWATGRVVTVGDYGTCEFSS